MKADGQQAEDAVLAWLQRKGLRLVDRNWRSRFGEIDLIMQDGATLVFVEVRKRTSSRFGGAAESITAAKRDRIITTARQYLVQAKSDQPCRFDAVLVDATGRIEWLRDAFSA